MISIAAIADVHSPRYLPLLIASVNSLSVKGAIIDLVIFAGDIVESNSISQLKLVVKVISKFKNIQGSTPPIIAVFGNEEYMGFEQTYISKYPEIAWVNDDYKIINISDREICIVGSRGVLMEATPWQKRNIPDIKTLYTSRLEKIKNMLSACKDRGTSITLLVTHYAPTFATLLGESPSIYKYLGYPVIERLSDTARPDIAIHGHAHNATRTFAIVRGVEVYNVSLPATKNLTLIKIKP